LITICQVQGLFEEVNSKINVLVPAVRVLKHFSILAESLWILRVDRDQVVVGNQCLVMLVELQVKITDLFHQHLVFEAKFEGFLESDIGLT